MYLPFNKSHSKVVDLCLSKKVSEIGRFSDMFSFINGWNTLLQLFVAITFPVLTVSCDKHYCWRSLLKRASSVYTIMPPSVPLGCSRQVYLLVFNVEEFQCRHLSPEVMDTWDMPSAIPLSMRIDSFPATFGVLMNIYTYPKHVIIFVISHDNRHIISPLYYIAYSFTCLHVHHQVLN